MESAPNGGKNNDQKTQKAQTFHSEAPLQGVQKPELRLPFREFGDLGTRGKIHMSSNPQHREGSEKVCYTVQVRQQSIVGARVQLSHICL